MRFSLSSKWKKIIKEKWPFFCKDLKKKYLKGFNDFNGIKEFNYFNGFKIFNGLKDFEDFKPFKNFKDF